MTKTTDAQVGQFVLDVAACRTRTGQSRSFLAIREQARRLKLQRVAPAQVIVGGTNGKGTTVAYLQQVLSNQGLRVGSTTSPHMHSYCERVTLDGEFATSSELLAELTQIAHDFDQLRLTYFDLTTLAALRLFRRWQVDVAIVEVGLGGRLDPANVIDADVSVITNVGLDHQEQLGDTVEAISREKVHIARTGNPLLFGGVSENSVVREHAKRINAPFYRYNEDFGVAEQDTVYARSRDGRMSHKWHIAASVNQQSFSLALQCATLLDHSPNQELVRSVQFDAPAGRCERVSLQNQDWILDIAHNPAAVVFVRDWLVQQGIREFVVVFGCFRDKDYHAMLNEITNTGGNESIKPHTVVLTDSIGERSLAAQEIVDDMSISHVHVEIRPRLESALNAAQSWARSCMPIVVLGSFDIVSRVREQLGLVAKDCVSV